jgi:hypothetical protein
VLGEAKQLQFAKQLGNFSANFIHQLLKLSLSAFDKCGISSAAWLDGTAGLGATPLGGEEDERCGCC